MPEANRSGNGLRAPQCRSGIGIDIGIDADRVFFPIFTVKQLSSSVGYFFDFHLAAIARRAFPSGEAHDCHGFETRRPSRQVVRPDDPHPHNSTPAPARDHPSARRQPSPAPDRRHRWRAGMPAAPRQATAPAQPAPRGRLHRASHPRA